MATSAAASAAVAATQGAADAALEAVKNKTATALARWTEVMRAQGLIAGGVGIANET